MDPPELSHALAERLGVTFPLLSDEDLSAIRAYGVEDAENGVAWRSLAETTGSGPHPGSCSRRSTASSSDEHPIGRTVDEARRAPCPAPKATVRAGAT